MYKSIINPTGDFPDIATHFSSRITAFIGTLSTGIICSLPGWGVYAINPNFEPLSVTGVLLSTGGFALGLAGGASTFFSDNTLHNDFFSFYHNFYDKTESRFKNKHIVLSQDLEKIIDNPKLSKKLIKDVRSNIGRCENRSRNKHYNFEGLLVNSDDYISYVDGNASILAYTVKGKNIFLEDFISISQYNSLISSLEINENNGVKKIIGIKSSDRTKKDVIEINFNTGKILAYQNLV